MTRTKRGYPARRRRTKVRSFVSGFQGAHSRLTRTMSQQEIRALDSAHRDRDRKKRDFRRLWITRINAAIRERGVSYSYSRFIHDLYKKQLFLNRKILAQIAIANQNSMDIISNEIVKRVDWKESAGINGVPRRMNSGRVWKESAGINGVPQRMNSGRVE